MFTETEPFGSDENDEDDEEEGVVELFAAAGVLLVGSMNGNPSAVKGHVGVAVNKEGNNHNGKRTRQGCRGRLYGCKKWRWRRRHRGGQRWYGRECGVRG